MPGKLCNGVPTDQPWIRESRAYCEGREGAFAGLLLADNPHPDGTRDHDLWDSGHASYGGGLGQEQPRDCCSVPAFDNV